MLKVATFNANSIRARLPIVLAWLERQQPDLLCLQETKAQDPDFPAAALGEAGYRSSIRGQKSYNGVAVLSRREPDAVRGSLGGEPGEEARFLETRFGDLTVISVYVPQGVAVGSEKFRYKLDWLRGLLDHLERRHRPDSLLLMGGDFNVALEPLDVHDPQAMDGQVCFHPEERKALRRLLEWGLADLFRKHEPCGGHYTFWDYRIPNAFKRHMGWRIDYLLATAPLARRSRRVWIDTAPRLEPKPSDHTFVVAEFEDD